jgi:hypothetical protein
MMRRRLKTKLFFRCEYAGVVKVFAGHSRKSGSKKSFLLFPAASRRCRDINLFFD